MQETLTSANESSRENRRGNVSWADNEQRLGVLMVAPAVLVLLGLVAYPFLSAVWLSFTDTEIAVGASGTFVWFENYTTLLNRTVFTDKVIWNTVLYTVVAVPVKLVLGMILALVLNRRLLFRDVIRGAILIPWVIPTSLSMIVFLWMFEPTFSVLNVVLERINYPGAPFQWLGTPQLALGSVMAVNIWRGTPFFAVTLLAALQVVPKEQVEAAQIDGANALQQFYHVTLPFIMPVIVVTSLFSLVRTFAEMEIVWLLTRGGPFNGTHMIGTYAYQQAIQSAKIGEGAAISLFFLPVMIVIIWLQLGYLQRREV